MDTCNAAPFQSPSTGGGTPGPTGERMVRRGASGSVENTRSNHRHRLSKSRRPGASAGMDVGPRVDDGGSSVYDVDPTPAIHPGTRENVQTNPDRPARSRRRMDTQRSTQASFCPDRGLAGACWAMPLEAPQVLSFPFLMQCRLWTIARRTGHLRMHSGWVAL